MPYLIKELKKPTYSTQANVQKHGLSTKSNYNLNSNALSKLQNITVYTATLPMR